jgi:hypothetical protein
MVALAGRYAASNRKERGHILDEFAAVSNLHRKHAMRLLFPARSVRGDSGRHTCMQRPAPTPQGPPRIWGSGGNSGREECVVGWMEFLSEFGTERTVVDRAPNLKQQVRAAS